MKVDVSEIKTFKACKRQWALSSRNKYHLRPRATPPQLTFGTIFHEALGQLYLGADLQKVMQEVRREIQADGDTALLAMIPGYYNNVLLEDLDRYLVLDIEHHFELEPKTSDGTYIFEEVVATNAEGEPLYDAAGELIYESSLKICGSIDMIVLDKLENKVYGFEHKTCKAFRDESYVWMDEQPRVYTWALQDYVRRYNTRLHNEWLASGAPVDREPVPVQLGGVYLNEVKKLLRQFQYKRTLCTYSNEDLDNFMREFFRTCGQCQSMVVSDSYAAPQPSYFGCQMCSFNTICSTYMYASPDKDEILNEFAEEFVERSEDHLEEKVERRNDSSEAGTGT